ncbi:MAG: SIS domain-containing protein [Calditrichia bacterium]
MSFPDNKYKDAGSFIDAYFAEYSAAAKSVNREKLQQAADILTRVYTEGGIVYSCGNGGSAAIANHLVCDHCKLVRTDTTLTSRIVSLSATVEIITAIGNDISYDEVFAYQLRCLAKRVMR